MPQPPYQVDQIQIDPSSGQTLIIRRNATTGAIEFVDHILTAGVSLPNILGMQSLSNVFVVNPSSVGSSHTTIQSALNDVPAEASDTNPYLILVTSGVYQEDITIKNNGVILVALGYVLIQSATATDTITIQEDTTIPKFLIMSGFHIQNTNDNQSGVNVVGGSSSEVGSVKIEINDCHFVTSGANCNPIKASSANRIFVNGGSMKLCSATSFCLVEECAEFVLREVADFTAMKLDYDDGGTKPSVVGSKYEIYGGNLNSNNTVSHSISTELVDVGSLTIHDIHNLGDISLGGNQTVTFYSCEVGAIVSGGVLTLILVGCKRGSASGSGTMSESKLFGSLTFSSESSKMFTFDMEQPDLDYTVLIENDRGTTTNDIGYCTKGTNNLTLTFATTISTSVKFMVFRDL